MSTSSRRYPGQIALWITVAVLVLFVAVTLVAASTPQAQATSLGVNSGVRPRVDLVRPDIAVSQVYTDQYDPNGTHDSAFSLGSFNTVSCASPVRIIANATFWQGGLPNPAFNVDWFKISLGAQLVYTLTVLQQTPSDLQFSANLFDPASNLIFSQSGMTNTVMSFYSPSGGAYYLQLQAANASVITDTQDKLYEAFLCSFNTNITPTPTNAAATNTPVGLVPDLCEPNDTIAEAAVPTGTRATPSFIAVDQRIDNLNFNPYDSRLTDSADWFEFYGHGGSFYYITTLNVQPGVETVLSVYEPVTNFNNPNLVLVAPLPGSSNPKPDKPEPNRMTGVSSRSR
jgi:hypothetical protein